MMAARFLNRFRAIVAASMKAIKMQRTVFGKMMEVLILIVQLVLSVLT